MKIRLYTLLFALLISLKGTSQSIPDSLIEHSLNTELFELEFEEFQLEDTLICSGMCVYPIFEQPKYVNGFNNILIEAEHFFEDKEINVDEPGTCFISFTVSEQGNLEDIIVARSYSPELDSLCLEFVQTLKEWTPGYDPKTNKPVRFAYAIPFQFHKNTSRYNSDGRLID